MAGSATQARAETVVVTDQLGLSGSVRVAELADALEQGATTKLVRELAIDDHTTLELREHTNSEFGDGMVKIALHDERGWSVWQGEARLWDDGDCGMGKCIDQTVERITLTQAKGYVWIRAHVRATIRHSDPEMRSSDRIQHHDEVIGCKLEPALACAWVQGSVFEPTTTTSIDGNVVTRRYHEDGKTFETRTELAP